MRHHVERQQQRDERQLPADHRCRATSVGRRVTAPSTVIGTPSAPKATGAVLKISVKVERLERREADQDQQRTR